MTYVNCLGCGCVDCPSYSLAIDCPMCGYRCVPVPVADMLTAPYNDICNLYMHVPGMDIYIYIPDMVCILTVPCVDVSTVPGMDVWTLPHMVYILTVPCMEMSTVPGVDGSVHALTALYNYGLHYWQPHVWMLTVPGVDVLTVADMVVVLAVLTGVNVLVVTGMGVLSVAGSRLLGLCFPSVSPIGIISVFPSAVSMKYFDVCVFSLIYLSNKSSDNIAVVIPCCSTGERQSWFRVLVA